MDFILTTHELSKRYRRFQALDRLTMHIPKGSIYGLIGRNGRLPDFSGRTRVSTASTA